MTVRPCLPWPDKRLRTKAEPVTEITDEIRAIWDDMIDTMEAMPGVGLAAPQIGVMLRLAVVDGSADATGSGSPDAAPATVVVVLVPARIASRISRTINDFSNLFLALEYFWR